MCVTYMGSLLAEHEGQRTNGKHKREGEEEAGTHHALRNVGIIAPYRAQRQLLASMIKQRFPRCDVEVSTVDGFQGREKGYSSTERMSSSELVSPYWAKLLHYRVDWLLAGLASTQCSNDPSKTFTVDLWTSRNIGK